MTKEKKQEYMRKYREGRKEQTSLYNKEYRLKNKDAIKVREKGNKLNKRYNITDSEFKFLAEKQQGRCAICGDKFIKTPHVDHCHKTGNLRSLLCSLCNPGLGYFRDSPENLRKAAAYLEQHNVI